MRQLRDTRRLKSWLRAGKTVDLRERDKIIARIVPETEHGKRPAAMPDFAGRARKILGDQILPNVVLEDRGRY
jgi:antitoxin (DNA-binding transcriptional repressor) of toxin-antitoxin stability system